MKNSINRIGILSAVTLIASVLALVVSFVVGGAPRVSQADAVTGTGNYTLLNSAGVTGTVTGTEYYSQYWGSGDCYSIYVASSGAQTATVILQHSPDTVAWVTSVTYAQQTSAGANFTRSQLYGAYTRAIAQISGTNPLTVSVKCALKNVEQ
ncbi:MAG: hypothetical protein ACOYM3_01160 [Terrimicrobiaceae bacterium]